MRCRWLLHFEAVPFVAVTDRTLVTPFTFRDCRRGACVTCGRALGAVFSCGGVALALWPHGRPLLAPPLAHPLRTPTAHHTRCAHPQNTPAHHCATRSCFVGAHAVTWLRTPLAEGGGGLETEAAALAAGALMGAEGFIEHVTKVRSMTSPGFDPPPPQACDLVSIREAGKRPRNRRATLS